MPRNTPRHQDPRTARRAADAAPPKTVMAYRLRGEATGTLELDIYNEVGPDFWGDGTQTSAKNIRAQLRAAPKAKAITVRINSDGGDVTDGLAMYSLLKDHAAKVTVRIDGIAASIASVIAMAGDEIVMAESAFMMIHNPWGLALGDADDMRHQADVLDKMGGVLADIYAERTGQPREEVLAAMKAETWMTGAEAKDRGYATSVVPMKATGAPLRAAAAWNLTDFGRVPEAVRDAVTRARADAAEPCPEPPKADAAGASTMTEEERKSALEAIKNGDGDAALSLLEAMLTAGGAPSEEPAPEPEPEAKDPPAAAAEEPPPEKKEDEEAKAAAKLARAVLKATGAKDAAAALGVVEGWQKSHAVAEKERAAAAVAAKDAEKKERHDLVAKKIGAGWELPANAWANPADATDPEKRELAEPYASMPIETLRAQVETLTKQPRGFALDALHPQTKAAPATADQTLADRYRVSPASIAAARDEMARAANGGGR